MRVLVKTSTEDHIKEYDVDAITLDFFAVTIYTFDKELVTIPTSQIMSMIIQD